MKITEVQVSAGRTFNNPYESFSNFRPGFTVRAVVEAGDDAAQVLRGLREFAEEQLEDHRRMLLARAEQEAGLRPLRTGA